MMWMRLALGAGLMVLPQVAAAQATTPRLIREAEYGVIREVEGDALMIATARDGCAAAMQPTGGGPCFDNLMAKLTATPVRVLGLYRPAQDGDRVAGRYGGDFALFNARVENGALVVERVDLPTSGVTVPRDCYRLNGEEVGYVIAAEKGVTMAYESQLVVCGGGPDTPEGPWRPEGPPIVPGASGGHHRTEMLQVWGQRRYLATTGTACEAPYVLRKTWCAQPGIAYLQGNPGVKELDLIAARQPVRDGDVLSGKQVDQWVLKRSGRGFKADSRWLDKSMLSDVPGCAAVEDIGWHVQQQAEGLYITEGALNRCGAPLAPVPVRIFEAYGDDIAVIDCAERRGGWRKEENGCFERIRGHLRATGNSQATLIVMNEPGRVDDHLYAGSPISHDLVWATLNKEGKLEVNPQYSYSPSVYLSNCRGMSNGPNESRGYVLVRSLGITRAREYQWMECPVY